MRPPTGAVARSAAVVAFLAAGSTLAACSGSSSDDAAEATDSIATGRTLAAIAISHLRADQVESTGGYGNAQGSTAIVDIRDSAGSKLYVNTLSPTYGRAGATTCAQARRQITHGDRLLSCAQTGDTLVEILSSRPGRHHAVLGYRISNEGLVAVWVEPATDDTRAQQMVESVLNDVRVGFRVGPDVVALGKDLATYHEVDAQVELRQVG